MIRNDEIRVCGCKLHGPCNMESIITLNIQLRCIKFMINPDSMITWALIRGARKLSGMSQRCHAFCLRTFSDQSQAWELFSKTRMESFFSNVILLF